MYKRINTYSSVCTHTFTHVSAWHTSAANQNYYNKQLLAVVRRQVFRIDLKDLTLFLVACRQLDKLGRKQHWHVFILLILQIRSSDTLGRRLPCTLPSWECTHSPLSPLHSLGSSTSSPPGEVCTVRQFSPSSTWSGPLFFWRGGSVTVQSWPTCGAPSTRPHHGLRSQEPTTMAWLGRIQSQASRNRYTQNGSGLQGFTVWRCRW